MNTILVMAACLIAPGLCTAQTVVLDPMPRQVRDNIVSRPGIKIFYHDTDRNGRLDRAVVHFTQNVDSASVGTLKTSAFAIYGYRIDYQFGIRFNIDNDGDGVTDGRNTVALGITERSNLYDSDATPQLVYNSGISQLKYESGASVPNIVDSEWEFDAAPPKLIMVRHVKLAEDDPRSYLQLTFSEPLYTDESNPALGFVLLDSYSAEIADTGHRIEGNTLYLAIQTTKGGTLQYGRIGYTPAPPESENALTPSSGYPAGAGVLHDYWYNRFGAIE